MAVSDSPLDFVQQQGWNYKLVRDQINLEVCPICGKGEWKFFINANNGMWDCKHSNSHTNGTDRGSLVKLRRLLGLTLDVAGKNEKPMPLGYSEVNIANISYQALQDNKTLLADLCSEWGIDEETARKWKLGFWRDNSGDWLTIPHYIGDKLYNIKFRSWFGFEKKFHRVAGASSVLLNEDILLQEEKPKSVVLCEGEKDAILATWAGIENVVGMTGGAGTLTDRWYKLLEPVEEIFVAYDGDTAGKEGTQTLIKRLGMSRVKIVQLPDGKDCADIVKEQGPLALKELFAQAKKASNQVLARYEDILADAIVQEDVPALPTFSPSVNRILGGGSRGGQLITVTAPPKIGKTSFCLAWAVHTAGVLGIPACYWCNEMPTHLLAEMIACMQTGCGRNPTRADLFIARQMINELPLYFGFDANAQVDVIIQTFRDAFKLYGIRQFFFDNIHFMVRSAESKVQAMEDAVKAFKNFAMETNSHVVIIAQPSGHGGKRGADMSYYDIAWSSAFASDSDTIMVIHRDRLVDTENSFSEQMMVKVDAGRHTSGGMTYLNFYAPQLQFSDYSKAELDTLILNRRKKK